ncbi:MAG: hypothetical protein R2822_13130 [Spirosomataceae bacterium]
MTQIQNFNTNTITPFIGVVGQARTGILREYADKTAELVGLTDKKWPIFWG